MRTWIKWALGTFFSVWVVIASGFVAVHFEIIPSDKEICTQGLDSREKECANYHWPTYVFAESVNALDVYNGLIQGVAAVAVVGFTLALWYVARTQAKTAIRQTVLMKKQLNLVQKTFLLTGLQADIAVKQKEIQRMQLLAAYRPQIIILTFEDGIVQVGSDRTIGVAFTFTNSGVNDALDVEVSAAIVPADQVTPNIVVKQLKVIDALKPGQKDGLLVQSNVTYRSAVTEEMKSARGQKEIKYMCVGRISYKDGTGAVRETGFCRVYDASKFTWERKENGEYEYSY